jgi:hypothetical protein
MSPVAGTWRGPTQGICAQLGHQTSGGCRSRYVKDINSLSKGEIILKAFSTFTFFIFLS